MASHRESEMRRSNSSSSIPVPSRASRLPLRNSMQRPRGLSVNRLTMDKRTSDRNLKRSNSHSNFLEVPQLRRQGSGSLARQNSMTPLQSRKSPLLSTTKKDNRPLTDRGWQYEQVVKVRNFTAKELPHLDLNSVKSGISIDVFVEVVSHLFKCIDDRINIMKENYVEEVGRNLKRYRYPTTIKPSLMKTVNTPHSWPHIIAILSWLVDLVVEINQEPEEEDDVPTAIENACLEAFLIWNQGTSENEIGAFESVSCKLNKKLEELLDVNEESLLHYDEEMNRLQEESKEFENKKNILLKEIEVLKANNKEISHKCDVYEGESLKFEKLTKEQIGKLSEQIKKIDEELIDATKAEAELKSAIVAQKFTVADKLQLAQDIKDLQYTCKLKEENCKHQEELMKQCDFQLTTLKYNIEHNAYEYNSIINELELVNEDLKECHIPVIKFSSINTKEKIEEINSLLKTITVRLKEEAKVTCEEINEKKQEIIQIDEESATIYSKVEKLSALDLELTMTLECQRKKHKSETESLLSNLHSLKSALKELKDLKKNTLAPLEVKLKELETRASELVMLRNKLNTGALEFFTSLVPIMSRENETYKEYMNEISRAIIENLNNRMQSSNIELELTNKAKEEIEKQ